MEIFLTPDNMKEANSVKSADILKSYAIHFLKNDINFFLFPGNGVFERRVLIHLKKEI